MMCLLLFINTFSVKLTTCISHESYSLDTWELRWPL